MTFIKGDGRNRFTGSANGKWKGGVHNSDKGYRRLGTKAQRNKYEHQAVIEQLLEAPLCAPYVYPELGKIPKHMTVDHVDQDKRHNCPSNLMLLEKRIHDSISSAYSRYVRAHYVEYLAYIREKNRRDIKQEEREPGMKRTDTESGQL